MKDFLKWKSQSPFLLGQLLLHQLPIIDVQENCLVSLAGKFAQLENYTSTESVVKTDDIIYNGARNRYGVVGGWGKSTGHGKPNEAEVGNPI